MSDKRKKDEELLDRLRADAVRLAEPYGLSFRSVRKTRGDARLFGSCDTEGHIRIRLRSLVTREFLGYSSLVATLCHELAHLRHFDHGAEFAALYRELLRRARTEGLYGHPAARLRSPILNGRTRRPAVAASSRPRRVRGRSADPPPRTPGGADR